MAEADPREAVVQSLCSTEGRRVLRHEAGVGWQPAGKAERPIDPVVTESIVFRKERRAGRRRAYVISYRTAGGDDRIEIRGVAARPDGTWLPIGSAGGGGRSPNRDLPWVNFAGWWGPEDFCAGGELVGAGAQAAVRVDLLFGQVPMFSDTVDDGVVLFAATGTLQGLVTARILGAVDELLATQSVFPKGFGPPGSS